MTDYDKQVEFFEALKAEHEAEGTEFECDICENPAEQPVQELEPDGTKIWWHVCESCAEQIERSNDRIQREITEEARGDYERDQAKDRMSYE